jgi:hypothetical protein
MEQRIVQTLNRVGVDSSDETSDEEWASRAIETNAETGSEVSPNNDSLTYSVDGTAEPSTASAERLWISSGEY